MTNNILHHTTPSHFKQTKTVTSINQCSVKQAQVLTGNDYKNCNCFTYILASVSSDTDIYYLLPIVHKDCFNTEGFTIFEQISRRRLYIPMHYNAVSPSLSGRQGNVLKIRHSIGTSEKPNAQDVQT